MASPIKSLDHILIGFSLARTPILAADAMYRLNRYCRPTPRLYTYKNRLIRLFFKEGYNTNTNTDPDLEVQLMTCRACGGTGVWYSDYGEADECNRCMGGIYKRVLHYVFDFSMARPYRNLAHYRWHQPAATVNWLPMSQAVCYLLSGYNPAYNPWLPQDADWRDWPAERQWSKDVQQLRDKARLSYSQDQIKEDLWTVWWYLALHLVWVKPPVSFNLKRWFIRTWQWQVVHPIRNVIWRLQSMLKKWLGLEQPDEEVYYDLDPDEVPF